MLRRIRSEQLQVGMFVARLGGPWINHPFWRAKFLVATEDQVRQIQSAGVQEVWIDILKGRNVPAPDTPEIPGPVPAPESTPDPMDPATVPPPAATLDAEIVRARELLQSGKAVIGSMFADIRMGRALEVSGALLLVDSASRSLSRHGQALLALARLKARGDDNYLHAFAVCALMIAVGRTLGLPDDEVRELGLAGLVHDIGKLTLPAAPVHKASERTPEEEEIYRRHPSAGYRILNEARLYSNIPLDVCVHHHERVDGRGFPYGLAGNELSVHAKIGAICDAYDSLTSSRPGHRPWSPARAMEYMAVRVDTLFDRRVFKAFTRTVGIYPLGTVLRLRSNRLAVVCAQNEADPLRPKVMAFYSVSQSRPVPTELIDLRHSDETVVAFENAADWGYADEQLMEMYAAAA
ncbi:Cyclic di-GMP phosphodiesterase [compost metagenome]|jgi:HD-GYP domain-containing protein (c-di-GMP phosphodiesterase class II)|uniref:Response regulator RpfG n=1 Tax=Cupriavidus necator (strain ATCC 43291 / DSM 13513 / CCUG 52238 / LMG 8453 / N-1) TaxID=1042878 RepID=G0EX45_CUPNN|nr:MULTISPECIES: HD-GYP domain-containing protein [Cupriavidus]AEI77218.1 response regulator RpfG [Cupriavidus necator N-1]KAI3607258.1 Two-component transcriptional response regulator, LuxR family [Cupriavidus necator H850]MDX6014228.1 HD-GYP domain-containing protein [Cupriavidus necator]QUN26734.1 HD-GYP domain-containing protein [Cupriavidus sp. KK10]